jgi:uncharacterized membrane protein YuzA (DUF378 family)
MKHKFKYFLTIMVPWLMMFNIEEYVIGVLCLLLQITFIGWPIASIWACKTLTQHFKKQTHQHYHEKPNEHP